MRYGMREVLCLLLVFGMVGVVYAAVEGATTTVGTSETATPTSPGNATADGGNITALNLSGNTQTVFWQGFWGQVTGSVTLRDTSGDMLYNWTWTDAAGGEVYASTNSTITWANIQASTPATVPYVGGGTMAENASATFTQTCSFTVQDDAISNVPCTYTYQANQSQTTYFAEGILNDTVSTVFVTNIEDDACLFSANATTNCNIQGDFQLIVPTPETATVTYYFWLELG